MVTHSPVLLELKVLLHSSPHHQPLIQLKSHDVKRERLERDLHILILRVIEVRPEAALLDSILLICPFSVGNYVTLAVYGGEFQTYGHAVVAITAVNFSPIGVEVAAAVGACIAGIEYKILGLDSGGRGGEEEGEREEPEGVWDAHAVSFSTEDLLLRLF